MVVLFPLPVTPALPNDESHAPAAFASGQQQIEFPGGLE